MGLSYDRETVIILEEGIDKLDLVKIYLRILTFYFLPSIIFYDVKRFGFETKKWKISEKHEKRHISVNFLKEFYFACDVL